MKHSCVQKILLAAVLAVYTALFSVSCYTPSPLYGTWADNSGSKITFMDDGTYSSSIVNTAGAVTLYSGTWTVLDNVLIFTKRSGSTIDTEWDIRGSMLYLNWVDDYNETKALTLYHITK
jgi:hypothetical protein